MKTLKELLCKLQTGIATQGSNLLNPSKVTAYCYKLSEHAETKSGKDWVKSVLRNWIFHRREYHVLCLPAHEKNSVWLKLLPEAFGSTPAEDFHYVDLCPQTPEWVVFGVSSLSLYSFMEPALDSEAHGELTHLIDYLNTLHSVSSRMSVEEALAAVARWDKRLARQKFVQDYHEGVEVCDSKVFEELENSPVLVKLVSQSSYQAEGVAQSNCVGNYFSKANTQIYSLRVPGAPKALATIEVRDSNVVQAKGPANSKVSAEISTALNNWATSKNFTWFVTQGLPVTDAPCGEIWGVMPASGSNGPLVSRLVSMSGAGGRVGVSIGGNGGAGFSAYP